jgi:hypothetical protein
LPAIFGLALQISHYIINVVTAIINEPQKRWLPDIVEFALSTYRTQNFITFLAWYFRGYCINKPDLWWVNSTGLFLAKNFVWRFFIFGYRGHLQALKVCDLETFYVWVNCAVLKSDFKMKNMIDDGMKMFRKYQLAIWRSIKNFSLAFYKSNKCECFNRIVEPCLPVINK